MPLQLIIVRHAIAFERDPKRWADDGLRPLSPEGRKKFQQAASGLARWIPEVDRVYTSPLVRAAQTATMLSDYASWPKAEICNELLPDKDALAPLSVMKRADKKRIAVVGHEPQLSSLIAACITADSRLRVPLKKGGVAVIEFSGRVASHAGTLLALVPPLVLRRMV
jgi:phosphohistidine phosphatase